MKRYRVSRAACVTRDFDLIEDHLIQSFLDFGVDRVSAMKRAEARIEDALIYLRTFTAYPHRGTEHPAIRPGIRTVTNNNFVIYFEIDETSLEVRILAAFFGGADYRWQIMDRLRADDSGL